MKDSKVYASKLRRLLRGLQGSTSKEELADQQDLPQALIYGVICEHFSDSHAQQMYRRIIRHFVDLNDLRVSTPEEIMDVWGDRSAMARVAATKLLSLLMTVFNKFHTLDLNAIKKTGKKPAKQFLQALDGISRFALDYSMLTCLGAHAIPVNEQMVQYLKAAELVHPEADMDQICSFLAKVIPAKRAYAAYRLLRKHAQNWACHAKGTTQKTIHNDRS
ncbi:MAG: hypothetical protein QHH07_09965 [Sedimentisphaerales bacterium]|jgi:endonuclease III|nr:hypothetical protein [Sedimentisphaerales bacterium]